MVLKFKTYYDKYIYNKIFTKRTEIGDYDKAEEEFKKDVLKGWNFDENDIRRKGYIRKDDPKEVYKYILKMFQTQLEKKDDMTFLYIHQGGIIGNESMLDRYKHKYHLI